MIKYCKTCLNPSTRFNTFFNDEGIYPVCVYENGKSTQEVDWNTRRKEIQEIKIWGVDESALDKIEECIFNSTSKRTNQAEINDYTLIGRGWVDS
jgi:hypothetical protein